MGYLRYIIYFLKDNGSHIKIYLFGIWTSTIDEKTWQGWKVVNKDILIICYHINKAISCLYNILPHYVKQERDYDIIFIFAVGEYHALWGCNCFVKKVGLSKPSTVTQPHARLIVISSVSVFTETSYQIPS